MHIGFLIVLELSGRRCGCEPSLQNPERNIERIGRIDEDLIRSTAAAGRQRRDRMHIGMGEKVRWDVNPDPGDILRIGDAEANYLPL